MDEQEKQSKLLIKAFRKLSEDDQRAMLKLAGFVADHPGELKSQEEMRAMMEAFKNPQ